MASPSQTYMALNQQGANPAMMPANQGLANAHDLGGMSKVYAEPQPERSAVQELQNINVNTGPSATYHQNRVVAEGKQMSLEESNKTNQIQTGLNQVLSTIMETHPAMPTNGTYTAALGQEAKDPMFHQRIANSRLV